MAQFCAFEHTPSSLIIFFFVVGLFVFYIQIECQHTLTPLTRPLSFSLLVRRIHGLMVHPSGTSKFEEIHEA